MKKTLLILAVSIFLFPATLHALCGDGKIDEGEKCDPAATEQKCPGGQICAPTTCQCVVDYAAGKSKPETTKKKVRIKNSDQ